MVRIPYSLTMNRSWHSVLTGLSDRFCAEDPYGLDETAAAWMDCLERQQSEELRTFDEYRLELLMTGVLLLNYSGSVRCGERLAGPLLRRLYAVRSRIPRWKSAADCLRGRLLRVFPAGFSPAQDARTSGICALRALEKRLAAMGDFDEELSRLRLWRRSLHSQESGDAVQAVLRAAKLFLTDAHNLLHPFVDHEAPADLAAVRRGREDYLFSARPAPLYYLNLFAAVLLNRAGRERFQSAQSKLVVLPGCMRSTAATCRARSSSAGLHCTGCSGDCAVHRITGLAGQHGAETVMVLHGSDALEKSTSGRCIPAGTGIVGVACAANLLSGGLKARRLGLRAQCVVLDAPGCQHWQSAPCATALDEAELVRILQDDEKYRHGPLSAGAAAGFPGLYSAVVF